MQTTDLAARRAAEPVPVRPRLWAEPAGWVRCQVMGRPAQLWTRARRDTEPHAETTTDAEDPGMLKKAKSRASAIWSSSAGLYREMALSALRLVRR
jgi:hypothetical protein